MTLEESQRRRKAAGRNDLCPCGSGQKYKKCHYAEDELLVHEDLAAKRAAAEAAAAEATAKDAEAGAAEAEAGSKKKQGTTAGRAVKTPSLDQKTRGKAGAVVARNASLPRRGAV